MKPRPYRLAAVSGGFDPLHVGHLNLFRAAKGLAESLVVLVEGDEWVRSNKHEPLMEEMDRLRLVLSVREVDFAVINRQTDGCGMLLSSIMPDLFVVGPDHSAVEDLPEYETCQLYSIKVVCLDSLRKDRSSSQLLRRLQDGP